MTLTKDLKEILYCQGADLVGIGDMSSEWLSPFLTPFSVSNDMRSAHLGFQPRRGEGVSPSADGDQRALPSGLLRAGLSSTS